MMPKRPRTVAGPSAHSAAHLASGKGQRAPGARTKDDDTACFMTAPSLPPEAPKLRWIPAAEALVTVLGVVGASFALYGALIEKGFIEPAKKAETTAHQSTSDQRGDGSVAAVAEVAQAAVPLVPLATPQPARLPAKPLSTARAIPAAVKKARCNEDLPAIDQARRLTRTFVSLVAELHAQPAHLADALNRGVPVDARQGLSLSGNRIAAFRKTDAALLHATASTTNVCCRLREAASVACTLVAAQESEGQLETLLVFRRDGEQLYLTSLDL